MSLKKKSIEKYSINATLKSFEDRYAILKTEDSQEFKWPIKYLPDNINPGDNVILKLGNENTEKNEKYQAMRELLEELVN